MKPENARPEYPRPQFVRPEWLNLNGEWEFDFDDARQGLLAGWQNQRLGDRINVPFPYQSELSGINDKGVHEVIWYSRTFEVPAEWRGRDMLLHFEAVDYSTVVWVNGQEVGHNQGGHVPFSFDISPYVNPQGSNRVTLRVEDRQDPYQPRGKQSTTGLPHHIDYYCTSGIWQTVWLEPAPSMRIESVSITPSVDDSAFKLTVYLHAPSAHWTIEIDLLDGDQVVSTVRKDTPRATLNVTIPVPSPKLWSPDAPHLYGLRVRLLSEGVVNDEIESYAGLRSIELRDGKVILNGEPVYLAMILDQGYWPGSYLAPPSDEALRADVIWAKRMGFNGVRKHQKIEDQRWLYWCDKLGMMVWGEMANARAWSSRAEDHLTSEWERIVRRDYSHPCLIAWVPVNESMGFPGLQKSHPGQYAFLERIVALTRRLDPERPVIDNDGWEHTDITDICAIHDYSPNSERLRERYVETLAGGPLPANAWDESKPMFVRGSRYRGQPIMLTEVGGYLMERSDLPKEKWDLLYAAYGTTFSPEDLLAKYEDLMEGIASLPFISGFCYTQLTDVEQEMNGLLTYDRIPKIEPEKIAAIHKRLFFPK
ncbi:MAG: glycoside hydrolase family 2 sugar binding protein [Capsulimonas sp.]|jgi:beta-galactosidase/beta-glucuronidase|nr:glycoside hydrolase family 2 sugar binding protein [Capsulimonas sp.]